MPGKRQPTDVIKANGRKHLSKSEEAQRRAGEVKVEQPKNATPPKWLPKALKADFRNLGKQLIAAGLYTKLDADTLGRYLIAHQQWLAATKEADFYLQSKDAENAEMWSRLQDRYFKQARSCATDMGLTVTSRCRLVIPAADPQGTEEANPFLKLIQGGKAANG